MRIGRRAVLTIAAVAAVVVFCIVQDRVTAAGARQYVELQRAALQGRGAPVAVEHVMGPAVRQSVVRGSIWGGVVIITGAALSFAIRDS
jgi:hypothetical protein